MNTWEAWLSGKPVKRGYKDFNYYDIITYIVHHGFSHGDLPLYADDLKSITDWEIKPEVERIPLSSQEILFAVERWEGIGHMDRKSSNAFLLTILGFKGDLG